MADKCHSTGNDVLWLSCVPRCSCKSELEPVLFFTDYSKAELLCSGHSPTHCSTNLQRCAEHHWYLVYIHLKFSISFSFMNCFRYICWRGCPLRGDFPEQAELLVQGNSHHTKSVQLVAWWAALLTTVCKCKLLHQAFKWCWVPNLTYLHQQPCPTSAKNTEPLGSLFFIFYWSCLL